MPDHRRDVTLALFRQSGALLEGHFKLSSGLHSNRYLQSALVLQHPEQAAQLGRAIAESVRSLRPNVVLSPALGGIVIGQETGRALGVRAIFAERAEGRLTLRRGFHAVRGGPRGRRRRRPHDRRLNTRNDGGSDGGGCRGGCRGFDHRSRQPVRTSERSLLLAGEARSAGLRTRVVPDVRPQASPS